MNKNTNTEPQSEVREFLQDLSLTAAWLKTKDSDGKYSNLRETFENMADSFKKPIVSATFVGVVIMSSYSGGLIAQCVAFLSHDFNRDRGNQIVHNEKATHSTNFVDLPDTFIARQKRAYKEASHKEYMIGGGLLGGSFAFLSLLGGTANTLRQGQKKNEHSPS